MAAHPSNPAYLLIHQHFRSAFVFFFFQAQYSCYGIGSRKKRCQINADTNKDIAQTRFIGPIRTPQAGQPAAYPAGLG